MTNKVPVLFSRGSQRIERDGQDAYSDHDQGSIKNKVKKFLPLPNFIVARPTLHDRLKQAYVFDAPAGANILNLGSGVQHRRNQDNLINLDIYPHSNADVAGDAHHLPFLSESLDGVWLCAVLEHLQRPFEVAAQVLRVLKPGGFVLVSVPFIQPVHASPHDYFRYTADGLRSLFMGFEEVESGATGTGPMGTWAEITTTLAGTLSRSKQLSYACRFIAGWALYPLVLLDKLICEAGASYTVCGGFCYLGKVANKQI